MSSMAESQSGTTARMSPSPSVYARPAQVPSELSRVPSASHSMQPVEQFELESTANPTASNAAEDETQYPGRGTQALVFFVATLAIVLARLNSTVVSTAVPHITDEFGTIADVGWYSAGYRLSTCAFQFMYGRIYRLWSLKRVFMSTIVVFEMGSLLCGLAPSSTFLVAGRVVQGIGAAGLFSGCFAMLTVAVPLRLRAAFIGAATVFEETAAAVGPLIGGVLTDATTWRWCFYLNLPIGLITVGLIGFFFKDMPISSDQDLPWRIKVKKVDLVGTAIIIPAMVSLLLALQYGGTRFGWADPRIIICLVLSAVLLICFGAWQVYKQDDATLPPRIIRQRSIVAGMVFIGCNNSLITVVETYIPIYFQTVQQTSAQASGLLILPFIIAMTIGGVSGGALTSWTGYWAPWMMFNAILAPIACGLLSTITASSLIRTCAYLGLLGLATGIGFQGPQVAAQTILPLADVPMGIACMQFASNFFPAVLVPAAQSLFTAQLGQGLGIDAPGVNATALEKSGLTDLRDKVQASQVDGTVKGFEMALHRTMYLPTAVACVLIVAGLSIEWRSCKKQQ